MTSPDFQPCATCRTPSTCRQMRHCNNPTDLVHARRELEEAAKAKRAGEERWIAAVLGVAAAAGQPG